MHQAVPVEEPERLEHFAVELADEGRVPGQFVRLL